MMASCTHTAEYDLDYPCFDCTPDTPETERLRSIGFGYVGGRQQWHDGATVREQITEMHENAKRYGNEPPEKVGSNYSGPVTVSG